MYVEVSFFCFFCCTDLDSVPLSYFLLLNVDTNGDICTRAEPGKIGHAHCLLVSEIFECGQ